MANLPPISTGVIENFQVFTQNAGLLVSELSVTDVYVHESILSPTLQMSINCQDTSHIIKNYFHYKANKEGEMPNVTFTLKNLTQDTVVSGPRGDKTIDAELPINNMRIYRMDNRRPVSYHIDEFTLHLCSPTTINNLKARMSDFYKMKELSKIVNDAMESAGLKQYNREIEKTDLKRDYISNNQHPYQVISEIADMATKHQRAQFLHFMTCENVSGKQYFTSIKKLIDQKPIFDFAYSEKGLNQTFLANDIMTYEFPCEFDTLLDLTSGIIDNKKDYDDHKPSMVSINPFDGGIYLVDGKIFKGRATKGFGGVLNAGAWSNLNNFEAPYSNANEPSEVEKYLHRRTENLSAFHRENINLKMVVPFNPKMHVGKTITATFFSKREGEKNYGSGKYLIAHLTHNVKVGGYSTTTMECIKISDTMFGYKEVRPKHQVLKDMPGLDKKKK